MNPTSQHFELDEFSKLYPLLDQHGSLSDQAACLLQLRDWYISLCDFDPLTHQAMPETLSQFLRYATNFLAHQKTFANTQDRFTRVLEQCYQAIRAILLHPKARVLREHQLVPISQVREVDNASVQWLSRQSGRNLREKLSGKNQMLAVQRRMSLNTAENRLLKACLQQIEEFLLIRSETHAINQYGLPEDHEEILQKIQAWLRDEAVHEIARWDNLPPNNVLLNDRHYRKIWDSWQHLKALDEATTKDVQNVELHYLIALRWTVLALFKNSSADFRLLDTPCEFDYDQFGIDVTQPIQAQLFSQEIARPLIISAIASLSFEVCYQKIKVIIKIGDGQLQITHGNQQKIHALNINNLAVASHEICSCFISKIQLVAYRNHSMIETDAAVLDIDSWQTRVKPFSEQKVELPLRFLSQFWGVLPHSEQEFVLDASRSQALRTDLPIVSTRHLWQEKGDPLLPGAIDLYVSQLQKQLQTKNLIYLVPDHVSDFATESLRYRLNFAYANASSLPKSIAALISWQNSQNFTKTTVADGDLFLIADNAAEGVFITPVEAKFSAKLLKQIPETHGFSWERHPSFPIDSISDKDLLLQVLLNSHATETEKACVETLCDSFHFDELYRSNSKFSLVSGDGKYWYHLPNDLKDKLREIKNQQSLAKADIQEQLSYFKKNIGQVRMLSISSSIRRPFWFNKEENWLPFNDGLIAAGETLYLWQLQVPEAILWRDHLPKLSTETMVDGHFQDFYFVKDAPPVQPKRGQQVRIPIKESFTLLKGKDSYEFPLNMGHQIGRNGFMARLDSPAFPLQDDVICKLDLSYTYGEDQPYQLKFIPKNEQQLTHAQFKYVLAKWLPNEKKVQAIAPSYPQIYRWADFSAYNNGKTSEPTDLYEWLQRDLNKIADTCQFLLTGQSESRITIDASHADWFTDRNGNQCAKLQHPQIGEIFIHENNFETFESSLKETNISCRIFKNKAFEITPACELPKDYKLLNKIFPTSFRFPMLTLWSNGNSKADVEVPFHFRKLIDKTIEQVSLVLENDALLQCIPKSIKGELRQLCCYMHKDMPNSVIQWVSSKSNDASELNSQSITGKIAYTLSNVEMSWQKSMLKNIIGALDKQDKATANILELLSVACWRHPQFIHQLTAEEIVLISQKLQSQLKFESKLIVNQTVNKPTDWSYSKLLRKLELLLALLRTRDSSIDEIKQIFNPESKVTKNLIKVLNEIEKNHSKNIFNRISSKDSKVQSRIQFNDFNKPESFQYTPDILYALRLYLTGDDGANLIQITGVSD